MEDEAQKMLALKRAYADIILNTAKEAAARIMVSERKALGFQQELNSTKDEALRMLVRLKQMIDAKTAEAGMISLDKQKKIDELEAQLNEAEDIITDLRTELRHAWLELEKTKNTHVQSSNNHTTKQVTSFEDSGKCEAIASKPSGQELACATTYDVKNNPLTQNVLEDQRGNATKQMGKLCNSNLENYSAHESHDSDFSSIIMRSKELELCKNGCTQRIRAFDGNLLDEKLFNQGVHDEKFGMKTSMVVKDDNGQVSATSSARKKMQTKKPSTSSARKKMQTKKPFKCHGKQKRRTSSYCKSCFLSCCKTQVAVDCKSNKGGRSLPSIKISSINKSKRKKRSRKPVTTRSPVCEPSFVLKKCSSVCETSTCSEDEYDIKMKPVPHLTEVEPVYGSNHVTSVGKVEVFDVASTNTDLEDTKESGERNGSADQVDESRLLKFTFQRKRKKESLENPNEKTASENRMTRRRVDDEQNGASEPQKSSFMDESSRDNWCLARVARQLISLSAKKW